MAHGITLEMRKVRPPEPRVFIAVAYDAKGFRVTPRDMAATFVKPEKDRSLPGKARRRALRAGRAAVRRVPFLKGYGIASANEFNQRYECPCGYGIVAPLDDAEFMTEVMDHEAEHTEQVSA